MENYELTLATDVQYADRSFETASWYDVYTLKAGTYPIELVERFGFPTRGRVIFDAILTEEYRVARLFTASFGSLKTPNTETTVTKSYYEYEVKPGEIDIGDGVGVITVSGLVALP